MTNFDNCKAKVEALEKAWKAPTDNAEWRPFGDACDWSIKSDFTEPIEELQNERKPQDSNSRQIELGDNCRKVLTTIFDGECHNSEKQIETPASPTGCVQSPLHFHCYQFDQPNHPRWDGWRKHKDYDETRPGVWWCKHVRDAASKYSWSADSKVGSFEHLALALQIAVRRGNSIQTAAICLVILTWGGVRTLAACRT